MAHACIAA